MKRRQIVVTNDVDVGRASHVPVAPWNAAKRETMESKVLKAMSVPSCWGAKRGELECSEVFGLPHHLFYICREPRNIE